MENLEVNQTVGGGADKEQEQVKNPFNRLPDELIVSHILDKIHEAKSLCFCSMASKHFSSLVYQSKTVSVKIPLHVPDLQPYPTNRRTPAKYMSNLTTKFLVKFTSMKSLFVEFDCSWGSYDICDICSSTPKEAVVKWKIDLASASFLLLFARTLDDDGEVDDRTGVEVAGSGLIRTCFLEHLRDGSSRFSLIKTLLRLLPESLENVVVKDSKKQGGLIGAGGGELVDVKMIKGLNVRNFLDGKGAVKYWHAPLLKLPSSGSVMRRASLIRYKQRWVGDGNEDDDLLAVRAAFQGDEEKVFGEAAAELLSKKKVHQKGFSWLGV